MHSLFCAIPLTIELIKLFKLKKFKLSGGQYTLNNDTFIAVLFYFDLDKFSIFVFQLYSFDVLNNFFNGYTTSFLVLSFLSNIPRDSGR